MALPAATFWQLITQAGAATAYAPQAQCDALVELLTPLSEKQIIGFELQLRQQLRKLYRYDVLAVAKLVEGDVSDDSFTYFCCNLVLLGPAVHGQVIRQPDALTAELTPHDTGEFLLSVADDAFEAKVGPATDKQLPREYGPAVYDYDAPAVEMVGEDWETEDLPVRFPNLAARYGNATA